VVATAKVAIRPDATRSQRSRPMGPEVYASPACNGAQGRDEWHSREDELATGLPPGRVQSASRKPENRGSMTKLGATLALLLLSVSPSFSQPVLNGNVWPQLDEVAKAAYVRGFLDGAQNTALLAASDPDLDDAQRRSLGIVLTRHVSEHLSSIQVEQIVDGIDAFYSDFRNRSILANLAASVAVMQVQGMPESKVNEFVEGLRRSARR